MEELALQETLNELGLSILVRDEAHVRLIEENLNCKSGPLNQIDLELGIIFSKEMVGDCINEFN